jgi:CBS domain-containing protein
MLDTIKELLDSKGNQVWSVTPETIVYDALKLMAEKNIGAVLVIDSQEELQGIFSERDYARKVALLGKSSHDITVSSIMTSRVFYVEPGEKINECMAIMTRERIRHVPVIENGELLGLVSIGDVVKSIISNQEFIIEQLEHYITGGRA